MTDLSSHVRPVVALPQQLDSADSDSIDMSYADSSPNLIDVEPSNGSRSPDLESEKDRIIRQLMQEIDDLKTKIQRIKNESRLLIDDKLRIISDLESQLVEFRRQLLHKQEEIEKFKNMEMELAGNEESAEKLVEAEKKAKLSEEKFTKMKDVYGKLRDEHVTLIRTKADLDRQLKAVKQSSQDSETSKSGLEDTISSLMSEKENLLKAIDDFKIQVAKLDGEVQCSKQNLEEARKKLLQESKARQHSILVSCVEEAENVVKSALNEIVGPASASLTCSPDYLLSLTEPLNVAVCRLKENYSKYETNDSDVEDLLQSICGFSHYLSKFIIHGKGTANTTPDIECGDELVSACRRSGEDTLKLLTKLTIQGNETAVLSSIDEVTEDISNVRRLLEGLIASAAANVEDQIGDMVEKELHEMDCVIEEAAARITGILNKSRLADTGIKLEVNEKILDACTALMQAIKVLVQRSKDLQMEIVVQGKGKASVKEFYKRNHRWTEGLLSAAKAVGFGATFLVDAADKVVNGNAKFEELMVASQEIAASTAQLVVASKVKADLNSQNMRNLSLASKDVSRCTGSVVATVQSCAQMMEESDVLDFSKLSLHQAKRYEMESQVKVLELESSLVKERQKLAGLRKRHYMLAGPGEGWEEEV